MKFNSTSQQNCNLLLKKISIFSLLLAIVLPQLTNSQAANSTSADGQKQLENDLQLKAKKAIVPNGGRAGRMLDLDRLNGEMATKSSSTATGNRQSRSGDIEERSKKNGSKQKMKINGFIPIVSMEGAQHLSSLTGGGGGSSGSDDDDTSAEDTIESQQQQGNLRDHLATSYGGTTSIGHASFPSNQQAAQQTGGEQQWQQAADSQPAQQVYSISSNSNEPTNQLDSARANRKLLGTSNLFSSLTGQPKRGSLVSSLIPSSLSLANQAASGYSSGNNYPYGHVASQPSMLAGPMNAPIHHQSQSLQDQQQQQQISSGECICVPFFQCKNGYLSESQLSKSQLSQLDQLNFNAPGQFQVPRSSLSSPPTTQGILTNNLQQTSTDLYYNQRTSPQAQSQYDTMANNVMSGQQADATGASTNQQQEVMNDIYEQLRKNMESGQLDQQMQSSSVGLIDERNAAKVNSSLSLSSSQGESLEERSLFNSLANRRSYQTAPSRSCGIMRTCCKVPPSRMTGVSANHQQQHHHHQLAHLSAARFVNPVGHLYQHQQLLISSPSVARPLMSQYQQPEQQQQQQKLAHRYLQTRPSRMNTSPQQQVGDFYTPPPPPIQNHQLAMNQLDSSNYLQQQQQLSSLVSPVGPIQPMVMESIMQQQQQQVQPNHQMQQTTALIARPHSPGSFMSGRCGVRQTLGIAGRVQNAPVVQGLEPGESSADFGEFPAHAAILKRISPGDSLFVCSAVLISSQWLATAAHCVRKHRPEEVKVRLGEWDVNRDDEFYPFFETNVREIIINPDFQPSSLANDLALIRLEQPVDGQQMPHVAPACLAQPEESAGGSSYATGQRCWVAGWGKNAFGQQGTFQSVLKKVDLPVVSHADCELALKYQTKLGKYFRLHQNNICAGGERGKDACEGDGGAGLYCLDPTSQLIKAVGLVSWGVGCGQRGVPGVYVNLANFNNWIENVVVSSGEENVYALMDGRVNGAANGSADFKNIISERTNDKAATNGTLLATIPLEQQESRSMGGNETQVASVSVTTPATTTTTTTLTPKTI